MNKASLIPLVDIGCEKSVRLEGLFWFLTLARKATW